MNLKYCNSLTKYSRFKTREVKVGDIGIGGDNPIRIQSMTTTDTMDTLATVEQSIRMIEAGCELVRITAPSIREAQNLAEIKKELRKRGFHTPLIADIHFTPNAAELAARLVEKVRINPGNYADKKKFEVIEYSAATYNEELERIREKFLPLVKICKENGTAMRIGTNHGSLSDRIMSRYGDTALGMVESAFEFLRIAEDEKYFDIVLSMKASNPLVMVHAYRLLVNKMMQEGKNYPLHLGVTEAGDGEDGRIKSAIGIGTLLEDGLGDTIRVSLTEDPEQEIPVAVDLANRYAGKRTRLHIPEVKTSPVHPFEYRKRTTRPVLNIGAQQVPVVVMDFAFEENITPDTMMAAGYHYDVADDKWTISDLAADYVFIGNNTLNFSQADALPGLPGTLSLIQNMAVWKEDNLQHKIYPLLNAKEFLHRHIQPDYLKFVSVEMRTLSKKLLTHLARDKKAVLVLSSKHEAGMMELRRMFIELIENEITNPAIIHRSFQNVDFNKWMLYASTDCGALLLDGLGDGIWLSASPHPSQAVNNVCFGILQGARQRISKTEYISCPSCGRTLFDLQQTTAGIRARTHHLKGVKIAVMGCIVNGPGEMADADYGYVGSGIGKITLYKGRQVMRRAIDASIAVDELIALIKSNGDWMEPGNGN